MQASQPAGRVKGGGRGGGVTMALFGKIIRLRKKYPNKLVASLANVNIMIDSDTFHAMDGSAYSYVVELQGSRSESSTTPD